MNERQGSENDMQHHDLREQLQATQQESAENRDKYLRALAESENMRKRLERLHLERVWQDKKRLLARFLEVADQLEAALKYAHADDPLSAGVRMTYQQLQSIMAQEGVHPMQSVGETFDPNLHEALEITGSSGDRTRVTSEFRKGYTLDDHLLRPARVQVERID